MSKSTKEKPYRGTKRDQLTIVLEHINSKFDLLADGHATLNQKFDNLDHKMEVMDRKFDVMDSNIYVLKNDVSILKSDVSVLKSDVTVLKSDISEVKHTLKSRNNKFEDHEERITSLERNS